MMRVLKAQQVGHFSYGMTFHQKVFCLVYYEGVDIADGGTAGGLMDHIAEVTGGISKFARAVCNGWKAYFVLQPF